MRNEQFSRDLGLSHPDDIQWQNDFPDYLANDGQIKTPPNKELAVAIAFYIFAACDALDDFCISKNVFGGWNRVTCGEGKWGAWESHCTKDFITKCKERLPWVEIW